MSDRASAPGHAVTGGWGDSSADDDLRLQPEDTRPGVGGDRYPTVAYLVPPEGADTSCLLGSESLCSVADVRASLDDITSLDLDAAAEAVVVEGATDEEEDLILSAWALLQDNVDLVKWAWCWATGETEAGDSAENHIQGEDFPDWLPDSWSEELAEWLSESWPDCDLTCVAENVFRWALYRRYPFVLRSDCCPADRVGADDARSGSTRSLSMTDGCNPYEPDSYDTPCSGWVGPRDDDHASTGRWARWA